MIDPVNPVLMGSFVRSFVFWTLLFGFLPQTQMVYTDDTTIQQVSYSRTLDYAHATYEGVLSTLGVKTLIYPQHTEHTYNAPVRRSQEISKSIESTEQCVWTTKKDTHEHCQDLVDTGSVVAIQYKGSASSALIYSQHNYAGGYWMNNVYIGQLVKVDGVVYQAVDTFPASDPPVTGVYLQTCYLFGNIHLIELQPAQFEN